MERLSKEGQRGGHAEDSHAESAGRSQDRPRPAVVLWETARSGIIT